MGLLIDGAMQQAAQPGRQAMASVGAGMCVERAKMGQFRVRAGGWSAPVLCFT